MSVGSEDGILKSSPDIVVKTGYLRKLKTMKKKYFVLRMDPSNKTAPWMEYYDSEKKFKNSHCPKRCISLKKCYVISRRTDTKHKYVIGLYGKMDCFSMVFECEDDLLEWFRILLSVVHGEDLQADVLTKPYDGHTWRVVIQKKELANCHNLGGSYLLCLLETTLKLLKPPIDDNDEPKVYELQLQCIRRCGNLDAFFYMELGQASCFGAGNLWMQAEDASVAQDMHSVIMTACTNIPKKEIVPKSRCRSSSANETSKPIYLSGRKWASSGDDSIPLVIHPRSYSHQEQSLSATSPLVYNHAALLGDGLQPHTFISYPPIRRASTGTRPVNNNSSSPISSTISLSSGKVNTSYMGRERCDSLPTRHRCCVDGVLMPRCLTSHVSCALHNVRPNTVHCRGQTFSPPNSSLNNVMSTNSINNDSSECYLESENYMRYNMYSLSPDGPMIPEENNEEYTQWGGNLNDNNNSGIDNDSGAIQNAGVHSANCPCFKKCTSDSGSSTNSNIYRSISNISDNNRSSYRSNSQTSCSSCGSSPMDSGVMYSANQGSVGDVRNDNFIRSPESANHSRESSIHEENYEDGYMTMVPKSVDTGYNSIENNIYHQCDTSSGASSCSITSGTPSTDARLSEYHLDKVSACFTPSDEEIVFNVRTVRAYSAGSKPEAQNNNLNNRCDHHDGLRTRAFSVGSRGVRPNNINGNSGMFPPVVRTTCNSASTSSVEPCDMVELDFSVNKHRNRNLSSKSIGRMNKSNNNETTNLAAEKLSRLSGSHSSGSSLSGVMDASPKASTKSNSRYLKEDSSITAAEVTVSRAIAGTNSNNVNGIINNTNSKQSIGVVRSLPKACTTSVSKCYNSHPRASPPISNNSYLSPTLERVMETSPASKNRCTCSNNNKQSIITSNVAYSDGEAYMDMKPGGDYKLDHPICTCSGGTTVISSGVSNDYEAAAANESLTSKQQNGGGIIFVPRSSSVQRFDGKIEYLDMSFGSSKRPQKVACQQQSQRIDNNTGDTAKRRNSKEFLLRRDSIDNKNISDTTTVDSSIISSDYVITTDSGTIPTTLTVSIPTIPVTTIAIPVAATAIPVTATANPVTTIAIPVTTIAIPVTTTTTAIPVTTTDIPVTTTAIPVTTTTTTITTMEQYDKTEYDSSSLEIDSLDNTVTEEYAENDTGEDDNSKMAMFMRQQQSSKSIKFSSCSAEGCAKRSISGSGMFFKKKSNCAHPSHQKTTSFLPLNISLPSSFSSLGRKNKKTATGSAAAAAAKKDKSSAASPVGSSGNSSITGSNSTLYSSSLTQSNNCEQHRSTCSLPASCSLSSSCPPSTAAAANISKTVAATTTTTTTTATTAITITTKSIGTDPITEVCNCCCGIPYEMCPENPHNPEHNIYPPVLPPPPPVHVPKLQRKISEPSGCASAIIGKSNAKIRNVIRQDSIKSGLGVVTTSVPINAKKLLLRSTSVPDEMSTVVTRISSSATKDVAIAGELSFNTVFNETNESLAYSAGSGGSCCKQTDDDDSCYVSFAPSDCKISENNVISYATLDMSSSLNDSRGCYYDDSLSSSVDNSEYAEISFEK